MYASKTAAPASGAGAASSSPNTSSLAQPVAGASRKSTLSRYLQAPENTAIPVTSAGAFSSAASPVIATQTADPQGHSEDHYKRYLKLSFVVFHIC